MSLSHREPDRSLLSVTSYVYTRLLKKVRDAGSESGVSSCRQLAVTNMRFVTSLRQVPFRGYGCTPDRSKGREVLARESVDGGCRLRIGTETADLAVDGSVSAGGVRPTTERIGDGWFEASLSNGTVERAYLADADPGTSVNIELPLSPDGRFDGHVVKGTVDTVTRLRGIDGSAESGERRLTFAVRGLRTCPHREGERCSGRDQSDRRGRGRVDFDVAVVPRTNERTALSALSVGDPVRFEADPFAKYAERRAEVGAV